MSLRPRASRADRAGAQSAEAAQKAQSRLEIVLSTPVPRHRKKVLPVGAGFDYSVFGHDSTNKRAKAKAFLWMSQAALGYRIPVSAYRSMWAFLNDREQEDAAAQFEAVKTFILTMADKYPALETEMPQRFKDSPPRHETLVLLMQKVGEHMGWDWNRV